MKKSLDSLLHWYQALSPETIGQISDFYTEDAFFKDPFNEFRSRENIRLTYQHMFDTLQKPRFFIKKTIMEGDQAVAIWSMEFGLRGKKMTINGCSHFEFTTEGRVQSHRDYWDAAEELYEKLPLIGWSLKIIKRRMRTKTISL